MNTAANQAARLFFQETTVNKAYFQYDGGVNSFRLVNDTGTIFDIPDGSTDINFTGNVMINETANANMTVGLTINQGANDNEILALKSSDVDHSRTAVAETDTYGTLSKCISAGGGLAIRGITSTGSANGSYSVLVDAFTEQTAADTAKTTSGLALFVVRSAVATGSTVTTPGADENLVVLQAYNTTRFIFDAEGSAHADVEWVAYADHDDLGLIRTMEDELMMVEHPDQTARRHNLEKIGIIGKDSWHFENGKQRAMVNTTKLQMLHHGALMQVGDRLETIDALLEAKDNRILALEAQIDTIQRRLH
jgi:hypothetical protein